ncbi:hypothetical protein JNM05_14325 [bacterium]|nr:hypothetical protein [bacterium]
MKRLQIIILALSLIVIPLSGYSQNQNTTFLHGYGSNPAVWAPIRTYLNNTYRLTLSNEVQLPSTSSVNSQASYLQTNLNQTGNLAIAHSMGGLVGRELIRQYGAGSKITKFITVGTPHQGARIVNSIRTGELNQRIQWLISDLKAGPRATFWGIDYVLNLLGVPSEKTIKAYINMNAQDAAATDLARSSAFITSLNASSSLSQETYMRAGIYSAESNWRPIRMYASTSSDKSDTREVQVINDYIRVASYWRYASIYAGYVASYYYSRYTNPYDTGYGSPLYLGLYIYFANISYQMARGWNALVAYFPIDWDYCTGAIFKQNGTWYWTYSDGLLTTGDQAFPNNNTTNWKFNYPVLYANHLQETSHYNVQAKLDELLLNQFNVPRR